MVDKQSAVSSPVTAIEAQAMENETPLKIFNPSRAVKNRNLNHQKHQLGPMENDVALTCSEKKLKVNQKK